MKNYFTLCLMSGILLSGCGGSNGANGLDPLPSGGEPVNDGVVVKSRATFQINFGGSSQTSSDQLLPNNHTSALSASVNQPIAVTNAAASSMTLNNGAFVIPIITNQLLDFGYLELGTLMDNNLKVCGTNGNQKCTKGLIRIYTTGTSSAGLYNSADDYGAPITAGQTTLTTVGLNSVNSAVVQTITIPNNKNVLRQTDFPNPKYNVQVDFSNAGAGTYSTTLVVEYGLSQ
jgi:hypothetical protein